MAKKGEPSARPEQSADQGTRGEETVQPASGSPPTKEKPVHEIRVGKVKAVIWANQTESGGLRHNVTLRRLFKRDAQAQWEQSDSFGRDDLPLVQEVSRQAWLWIYDHG